MRCHLEDHESYEGKHVSVLLNNVRDKLNDSYFEEVALHLAVQLDGDALYNLSTLYCNLFIKNSLSCCFALLCVLCACLVEPVPSVRPQRISLMGGFETHRASGAFGSTTSVNSAIVETVHRKGNTL